MWKPSKIALALLFIAGAAEALIVPVMSRASSTDGPSGLVIRKTLETYVRAHPYAVVAFGLVRDGRETTYMVRGSGAHEALDDRTPFQIGSITKLFTATVLAQMVNAGEVRLNDPIQQYLSPSVRAPVYRGHPITVLDLANHTSALPGNPPNMSDANESTYSIALLNYALSNTTLNRLPGSKWDYSNFGYAVLGEILERKAGALFDDLIEGRILRPLQMDDTVVTGSATTKKRMPPSFQYGGAPAHAESIGPGGAPAGSMESDLKDMLVFLKANLDAPYGALGRAFAFAQQPRTPVPEWNMTMGLAWQTVLAPTHRVPDDLGDLPSGSVEKGGNTDGYSSFIAMDRNGGWGIVAMTNVNDDDFQQVISHAVSPSTARMPILWALVKKDPSPLSGTYVITKGRPTIDIFKYRGDLYIWVSTATPAKLKPLSRNRYSLDQLNVQLTFHLDGAGNAIGLTVMQNGRTMHAIPVR